MDENVIEWINKIRKSYVACTCGEICHIDVTIRSDAILFRVICPECKRAYTVMESFLLVDNANIDITDIVIDEIKNVFSHDTTQKKI